MDEVFSPDATGLDLVDHVLVKFAPDHGDIGPGFGESDRHGFAQPPVAPGK